MLCPVAIDPSSPAVKTLRVNYKQKQRLTAEVVVVDDEYEEVKAEPSSEGTSSHNPINLASYTIDLESSFKSAGTSRHHHVMPT